MYPYIEILLFSLSPLFLGLFLFVFCPKRPTKKAYERLEKQYKVVPLSPFKTSAKVKKLKIKFRGQSSCLVLDMLPKVGYSLSYIADSAYRKWHYIEYDTYYWDNDFLVYKETYYGKHSIREFFIEESEELVDLDVQLETIEEMYD